MEVFKSGLRLVFKDDLVQCFNVDYLYDTFGKDFNDLLHLFHSWEFKNDADIVFIAVGEKKYSYMSNENVLLKKFVSFNMKLLHLPIFYTKNIISLTLYLMSMISRKVNCETIFAAHMDLKPCGSRYVHVRIVNGNSDVRFEVLSQKQFEDIPSPWHYLHQIYNSVLYMKNPHINCKHDDTLDNHKLMKLYIEYVFQNDCCALNLDYIYEELDCVFDEILTRIKEAFENTGVTLFINIHNGLTVFEFVRTDFSNFMCVVFGLNIHTRLNGSQFVVTLNEIID